MIGNLSCPIYARESRYAAKLRKIVRDQCPAVAETLTSYEGVVFTNHFAGGCKLSADSSRDSGIRLVEVEYFDAARKKHAQLPYAFIDSCALVGAVPKLVESNRRNG